MQRMLPVWLFLFALLLGALFTVAFAWVVRSAEAGSTRFGQAGKVAVAVASFPDMVITTLRSVGSEPDSGFRVPRTSADLSQFQPITRKPGIHIQGLMLRANRAALARTPGWRVLVGGFIINGELMHAALALSPHLQVVKVWKLAEENIPGEKPRPVTGKFIHGFALLTDGSVIFTFDEGVSIQRFDRCGRRMWVLGGPFDHAVSLDEREESVWTLRRGARMAHILQVATATGKILRSISMDDIAAANPSLDILHIRQYDDNSGNDNPRNKLEKWLFDPFHLNDVEPLPAALADRFEGFQAGDLLVSARSLNLVFVIDPRTLAVKWWRSGLWRRQHDPDWQPTGEITVYDNRLSRDYSRIVSIAPAGQNVTVLFDGRTNDFYSRIRGKHQVIEAGHLLIASPQQGRAFEVDSNGQTVFEIFNTRPGSDEFNYPLSEALWYPLHAFNLEKDFSCAN